MKYKIGDKVRVREDLVVGELYGDFGFSEDMEIHRGEIVTIKEQYYDCYYIEEDEDYYCWTDDMFEPVQIIPHKTRGFEVVSDIHRKHTNTQIQLPTRGSKHAIAYDIYSPIDITIAPSDKQLIWTDVKAYFKENEALLINVRSSMGSHPIIMGNVQGWVECDYYNNPKNDGNLGVNLLNLGTEPYIIKKGDRIAQVMFIPFLVADSGNTDAERVGGHGSTGK